MLALLRLLSLPLFVGVQLAQANHTTCSWVIGFWKQSPIYNGFSLWCTGALRQTEDGHGDYTCLENKCVQIADWGVLGEGILEWGTPCGNGGYGFNVFGTCIARFWALCLGNSNDGNCYYMDAADDCQWPTSFVQSNVPRKIELWGAFYPFDMAKKPAVQTGKKGNASEEWSRGREGGAQEEKLVEGAERVQH